MAARVLNPRPADVADGLSAALAAVGLDPVAAPAQHFAEPDPDDVDLLDDTLLGMAAGEFGLLVVTSARTVRTRHPHDWITLPDRPSIGEFLALAAGDAHRQGARVLVASVGPATSAALVEVGIDVDIEAPADAQSAEGLVAAISRSLQGGATIDPAAVLFPGSAAASHTLAEGLLDLGLMTEHVPVYVPQPAALPEDVAADLRSGRLAAAVLTSPGVARTVLAAEPATACRLVAIGAPTARAIESAGRRVAAVADAATDAALADAVLRALDEPAPCPRPRPGGESTP